MSLYDCLEMRDSTQLICKLMVCTVWFSFIPRSLFDFNELNECLLFFLLYALQTSCLPWHFSFDWRALMWKSIHDTSLYTGIYSRPICVCTVCVWESSSARCPLSFVVEIRVSVWGCVHVCVSICVLGCGQCGMVIIASRIWERPLLSVQYFWKKTNWKLKNWPIFSNITSLRHCNLIQRC